jgi:hypothetical protein
LKCPPGWVNCTVVAARSPYDTSASVTATKEPLGDGETLRMRQDWQLREFGRTLAEFDLLESRETTLAARPALQVRFRWVSDVGPVEQSLTMVEGADTLGRHVVTIATSASREGAAAARAVFARVLGSARVADTASLRLPPNVEAAREGRRGASPTVTPSANP